MRPTEIMIKVLPHDSSNLNKHLARPVNFSNSNTYIREYVSNIHKVRLLASLYESAVSIARQLEMSIEELRTDKGIPIALKFFPNESITDEDLAHFVQICEINNDVFRNRIDSTEAYSLLKSIKFFKDMLLEEILLPLPKKEAERIYKETEKKFAIAPLFPLAMQSKGENYVKCSLTTNELRNNNLNNLAYILPKMRNENVIISNIGKLTQLTVPTILIQARVGKNNYIYFANSYGLTTIEQDSYRCKHYPYMKDITNEKIDYLSKYIINVMRNISSVDDKLVKIMELAMSNTSQEKLRNQRFNELVVKNTNFNKYSFSSYCGIAPCIAVSKGKLLFHGDTVILITTNRDMPNSFVKSILNYSERDYELLYNSISKFISIPVEDVKLLFAYYKVAHDLRRKI